jgi:hypothetical protein
MVPQASIVDTLVIAQCLGEPPKACSISLACGITSGHGPIEPYHEEKRKMQSDWLGYFGTLVVWQDAQLCLSLLTLQPPYPSQECGTHGRGARSAVSVMVLDCHDVTYKLAFTGSFVAAHQTIQGHKGKLIRTTFALLLL